MAATQICVSLTDEMTSGMVARMAELSEVADLFEIRADHVSDLDLLAILRARRKPLVLTCRAASEGGLWPDDDPRRRRVLLEGVKRGFDYVDVELRSRLHDVMVEKAGRGLIVSYHDFQGTPADLDEIYGQMCELGADIAKIAVTPRTIADVARLVEFANQTSTMGPKPVLPVAMGPLGVLTRIIGGRFGSPFTFAAPAAGAEAAPGQVPAARLRDLYRVNRIGRATKVYGILGRNVGKSLSPVLHNTGFQVRGIDAVYVPLEVDDLPAFVKSIDIFGIAGFSVTRPYKVDILPHLHAVDDLSAMCGSVNTVVLQDGVLQGSTTDGIGVTRPIKKKGIDVRGKTVILVGAGGASRSAALALKRKGADVLILARDAGKAQAVGEAVGCRHGDLANLANESWDVLINATPVGSSAMDDTATPVPAELLRPGALVFDMVYVPLETRLLREAKAAGCQVIDGLEMLLSQAVGQFETWTGLEAPIDEMREALHRAADEANR